MISSASGRPADAPLYPGAARRRRVGAACRRQRAPAAQCAAARGRRDGRGLQRARRRVAVPRSTELRRSRGALKAIEQRRAPEPGPDVWLVFAPIKRARLDWLVEKATELGVAALVPVWTARTQSERVNRERLRVIADRRGRAERAPVAARDPPRGAARAAARRLARRPAPDPVRRERRRPADRRGARRVPTRRRRRRCLSARKAASPKRSLTLSANSPLLRGSGSARGCCAPRPPLLPRWRFFRRSPATGAASGRR